jgi:hypothetical protein
VIESGKIAYDPDTDDPDTIDDPDITCPEFRP